MNRLASRVMISIMAVVCCLLVVSAGVAVADIRRWIDGYYPWNSLVMDMYNDVSSKRSTLRIDYVDSIIVNGWSDTVDTSKETPQTVASNSNTTSPVTVARASYTYGEQITEAANEVPKYNRTLSYTNNHERYATSTPSTATSVTSVTHDFNGDGIGDILWYNKTTGMLYIYLMKSDGTVLSGGMPAVVPDLNWHIVAVNDYNGDGKSDILWRNTSTGLIVIWYMNGTSIASYKIVSLVPDNNWQIIP
ncbi:MAG: VCBS repeat-containing protein [Nitrospirae bacterium]|nr:VCBS repeat-containing protein [Nitrospirota bacterium]